MTGGGFRKADIFADDVIPMISASGGLLGGKLQFGNVHFGEGVGVIVETHGAFESGKVGAGRNWRKMLGGPLTVTDAAFVQRQPAHC